MPRMNGKRAYAASQPDNNNIVKGQVLRKRVRRSFPLNVPDRPSILGRALVCGLGDVGQLGLGDDASKYERKRPTPIAGIENVVDVCAGGMHTLILTHDGCVYSFGCNDEGALGRDTSEEGSEYEPGLIELPQKVVQISAGDSHSACLLANGRVMAWGSFRDSHGNMGLTLDGNKRVPSAMLPDISICKIASGADHLVMLTCSGHVFTIGCAEQGQLGRISQRSASGESRRGKTEILQPCEVILPRCKLIDGIWATNYCTFLKESGTGRIFAFGLNNYNQLGYKKETGVVSKAVLTEFADVKKIAGGQHHTMVLKVDGTVQVIGRHDYGRLGLGKISNDVQALKIVETLKGKNIVDISCGESTSFALTGDGKVYSWGIGSNNQLGTGSDEDELVPVNIQSKETTNKNILRVDSGGQHSVFLVEKDSS